jgi:hypothetical protein
MIDSGPTPTEVLDALASAIGDVAGDDLVGLYVYGSYVSGGFDPDSSDLDLVAVLDSPVGDDLVARIGPVHHDLVRRYPSWSNRLDVVYIGRAGLVGFRDGVGSFAVISPGEPFHLRTDAADWLQSWYLLRETSRPLSGPDPRELVPPISRTEFVEALAGHCELMRRRSRTERSAGALAYEVLTVCRVLHTITTHTDPSKAEAAAWTRRRWPAWAPIIDAALACRHSGGRIGFDDEPTRAAARQFIDLTANEVASIRRPA